MLYAQLKNTVQPADAQDWPAELAAYEKLIPAGVAAVKAQQAGQKYDKTNFNTFVGFIERFQFMANLEPPLILPPDGASRMAAHGRRAARRAARHAGGRSHPRLRENGRRARGEPAGRIQCRAARITVRSSCRRSRRRIAKARAEVFFNQMEPFYNAMVIYVLAGLLAVFSGSICPRRLRRSAVWLVGLAFVIHTTGLIYRMVLEGRPPVTNLYSSAIFIGWGACLLGMILEKFYKNGIGVVVSAGIGFITLIIAHHLALEGDTMEMMRAVLDTNFWLATHVVAVTIGYASTFVAGFLALIYIVRGVFTRTLDAATGKSLARMVYGIVCFATLFSFVGTVLGGIWADQSWGRFWGWDPKENGALLIVLWNALILHARWGGMIRERGLDDWPSSATSSPAGRGSASTCSASACTATASPTRRSDGCCCLLSANWFSSRSVCCQQRSGKVSTARRRPEYQKGQFSACDGRSASCDGLPTICDALPTTCDGDFRSATGVRRLATPFRPVATAFRRPTTVFRPVATPFFRVATAKTAIFADFAPWRCVKNDS